MKRRSLLLLTFFIVLLALTSFYRAGLETASVLAQEEQEATHRLLGPFWTTEGNLDTILLINNPDAAHYELLLTLYSSSGEIVREEPFLLAPVESRSISLKMLVGQSQSGSLMIR